MKTKHILAVLGVALLAAFAFSGCATTGGNSGSGVHYMGSPKMGYPMSNQNMPGR